MAIAVLPHAPACATGRWLVTGPSSEGAIVVLRDYFRRLGLRARVSGRLEIEVDIEGTDVEEPDLKGFLESWTAVNGLPLQLRSVPKPAPLLGPPRIGELLMSKGLLTSEQLDHGLAKARESGELLGVVLIRDQIIFEEDLSRTLSTQLSIPYVSIFRVGLDRSAALRLPREVGLRAAAIPVRFMEGALQVAFADPSDLEATSAVSRYLPNMVVAVADLSDIMQAWRRVSG